MVIARLCSHSSSSDAVVTGPFTCFCKISACWAKWIPISCVLTIWEILLDSVLSYSLLPDIFCEWLSFKSQGTAYTLSSACLSTCLSCWLKGRSLSHNIDRAWVRPTEFCMPAARVDWKHLPRDRLTIIGGELAMNKISIKLAQLQWNKRQILITDLGSGPSD